MGFVRTVLGDVEATALGVCYAHEHIIIERATITDRNPEFLLDAVESAVEELKAFYAAGGRGVIDSTPCDCGRNVLKMAEVSRQSGVRIVIPTGLHLAQHYDSGHWGHTYSVDQLATLFIADIEEGVDAHDYGGPFVQRTDHRAGVIKVAGEKAWTDRERRSFEAAALAHRLTGAPILTHTEQGELGVEQAAYLQEKGADLSHVVLSHLDRKPDLAYHREILSAGVCVEYDSAFRWKDRPDNPTLDLVLGLIEEFPEQIMLGMDMARRQYWKAYGGAPGLTYLLSQFSDTLREAGLSHEHWEQIFVHTPQRAYSFINS